HYITCPALIVAPVIGSGKTTVLNVSGTLVANPEPFSLSSAAAITRVAQNPEALPTILYDEVDRTLGMGGPLSKVLETFLSTGYKRGGSTLKVEKVGNEFVTKRLNSFAPVLMTAKGTFRIPSDILSRSIVINMEKLGPGETREYYPAEFEPEAMELKARLAD